MGAKCACCMDLITQAREENFAPSFAECDFLPEYSEALAGGVELGLTVDVHLSIFQLGLIKHGKRKGRHCPWMISEKRLSEDSKESRW